jgi:hypothetical protein
MAFESFADIVLGAFVLVFLAVSILAVYGVFGVALNRRGEVRGWLAKALYYYGIAVIVASVLGVGLPAVLKIIGRVWTW